MMAFLNRTKQNNCARDRQGNAEYKGGADSPTHEQSKAESQESCNCDLDDGSGQGNRTGRQQVFE